MAVQLGCSWSAIQPLRLDVGFDAAGDHVADGSAIGQALPQELGGDADRWDGHEEEVLGARPEARQDRRIHFIHPGAVDHDDRGQAGNSRGVAPGWKVDDAVGADQEEEIVAGPLAVHGVQRIDAVVRAGAAGLDLGNLEGLVAGDRDPGHLDAVRDRRAVSPLVRRSARDDKPDPVEPAGLAALLGQDQVAEMDRIECAAEKTQPHGVETPARSLPFPPLIRQLSTFLWTNVQKLGELAKEGRCRSRQNGLEAMRLAAAILDDRPDTRALSMMIDGDAQREGTGSDEVQTAWFGLEDETKQPAEGSFVGVVVNRPIEQVLTYWAPSRPDRTVCPGQRLRVPLGRGNRLTIGYCVSVDAAPPEGLDPRKLKEVVEVLDPVPLIDAKMLELTRWMAEYYVCSWGQALDAAVPAGVRNQAGTRVGTFLLVPEEIRQALKEQTRKPKLSPKQAAVLEVLCRADEPLTISDVCRRARCASAPVLALRRQGLVHSVRRRLAFGREGAAQELGAGPSGARPGTGADGSEIDRPDRAEAEVPTTHPRLVLTGEQESAMAALTPVLRADGFAPILIHGVTGSGKTEIYLSAIEQVVARGREAIVLVPEISLTPQTIRRFRRRFARVAVLHSHLSDVERHRHWQSIAAGKVEVVVGVRSAIFAPARRLGLIVIDEEHESTFKQETVPRYHARDVAVKRAQLERVPVLLGSATPSLESWQNSERGRYTRLVMPNRVEGRPMPAVDVIDLRHEKQLLGGLSETLRQAMHRASTSKARSSCF